MLRDEFPMFASGHMAPNQHTNTDSAIIAPAAIMEIAQ
jgi:hypothetical protein